MRNRELVVGVSSAVAGVLVTVAGAVLFWPDSPATSGPAPVAAARPTEISVPSGLPTVGVPTEAATEQGWAAPSPSPTETETDWWDREPADAPPLPDAAPAGQGELPDSAPVSCPAATTTVGDAAQLAAALGSAAPGDSIRLQDGTYVGEFVANASGTAQRPIFLCGGPGAVLDGGDVEGGYVLHLDGAKYWRLVGFTVTNGQKGVMTDGTVGSVIQGLTVRHIGDEAIHLRKDSTDNVVLRNRVSDTGNRRDKYGEGIYVGTAVSNWCEYTDCRADRSDRNVIKDNAIVGVTSEAVDIKEGTTGGVVLGNTFDGSRITGADSWIDVKGNNWLIKGNSGSSSPEDGFQTHEVLNGWGNNNVFTGNLAAVHGPGYGFSLTPEEANVVTCDNRALAAAEGVSNVTCG
jgi:hypothetical protein